MIVLQEDPKSGCRVCQERSMTEATGYPFHPVVGESFTHPRRDDRPGPLLGGSRALIYEVRSGVTMDL